MAGQVTLAVVISIISVGFSIFFGFKNSNHTNIKDIEERAGNDARINSKLDEISRNVSDTKYEISSLRNDMNQHHERLIKVEENVKSAHHRLDTLEQRINGEKE